MRAKEEKKEGDDRRNCVGKVLSVADLKTLRFSWCLAQTQFYISNITPSVTSSKIIALTDCSCMPNSA